MFTAAGGYVHLREWLDTYRAVPADAPGAAVVRVGFPLNAAASFLVAVALLATLVVATRFSRHVVVAAIVLQVGSLGMLIATRTGSVLGWTEPVWTRAANQSRAVEIGALVVLLAAIALTTLARRAQSSAVPAAIVPVHAGR
jgi:hypothetical protein